MKKILFVFAICFQLLCYAQNEYQTTLTWDISYYKYELLPNSTIQETKICNTKETRAIKIFAFDKHNYAYGYSDSLLVKLYADKSQIKNFKKNNVLYVDENEKIFKTKYNKIKENIYLLWESQHIIEQEKNKIEYEKNKKIEYDSICALLKQKEDSLNYLTNNEINKYNPLLKVLNDSIDFYEKINIKNVLHNEKYFFIEYNSFSMDFCGGVEPNFNIVNCSNKTIKYIYVTCVFYNAVNDILKDKITNEKNILYTITGPIKQFEVKKLYSWDSNFYNSTTDYYIITSITIQYMDNTKISFNKNDINKRTLNSLNNAIVGQYDAKINELKNKYENEQRNSSYEKNKLNILSKLYDDITNLKYKKWKYDNNK